MDVLFSYIISLFGCLIWRGVWVKTHSALGFWLGTEPRSAS